MYKQLFAIGSRSRSCSLSLVPSVLTLISPPCSYSHSKLPSPPKDTPAGRRESMTPPTVSAALVVTVRPHAMEPTDGLATITHRTSPSEPSNGLATIPLLNPPSIFQPSLPLPAHSGPAVRGDLVCMAPHPVSPRLPMHSSSNAHPSSGAYPTPRPPVSRPTPAPLAPADTKRISMYTEQINAWCQAKFEAYKSHPSMADGGIGAIQTAIRKTECRITNSTSSVTRDRLTRRLAVFQAIQTQVQCQQLSVIAILGYANDPSCPPYGSEYEALVCRRGKQVFLIGLQATLSRDISNYPAPPPTGRPLNVARQSETEIAISQPEPIKRYPIPSSDSNLYSRDSRPASPDLHCASTTTSLSTPPPPTATPFPYSLVHICHYPPPAPLQGSRLSAPLDDSSWWDTFGEKLRSETIDPPAE